LSADTGAICRNCGAGLAGRYCSNCGQAADVHVPSTSELIHEMLEGLTHSDSRIWLTLRCLLFRPGRLTQEFVAGRRATYLPPFRLYLILSVAFFLLASFSNLEHTPLIEVTPGSVRQTQESDCTNGTLSISGLTGRRDWDQRLERACVGYLHDSGKSLLHTGFAVLPKAIFVLLPLIALLHMLMYWRPRHRYAVHLLFFLHLHAFFFFVATLLLLLGDATAGWPAFAPVDDIGSTLLFWAMIVYGVIAMRRVFAMGWALTMAKAAALSIIYFVMLGVTLGGVFLYAALQL
jgi:Protein of unknown function (DUF3667)